MVCLTARVTDKTCCYSCRLHRGFVTRVRAVQSCTAGFCRGSTCIIASPGPLTRGPNAVDGESRPCRASYVADLCPLHNCTWALMHRQFIKAWRLPHHTPAYPSLCCSTTKQPGVGQFHHPRSDPPCRLPHEKKQPILWPVANESHLTSILLLCKSGQLSHILRLSHCGRSPTTTLKTFQAEDGPCD